MTNRSTKAPAYHVPAEPFLRLIRERIEREHELFNDRGNAMVAFELFWEPQSGVDPRDEALSHQLDERLRAFLERNPATIDFDLADKIVTRLCGAIFWREDPELAEIYENATLIALDMARPTCEEAKLDTASVIAEAVEKAGHRLGAAKELGVSYDALCRFDRAAVPA